VLTRLRNAGIRCELYPDAVKMKKQMAYADSNHIPFMAIVGENEINEGTVTLKNMVSGVQKPVTLQEIISNINLCK
jgi:histidyl-tRNA synthetase